MRVNVDGGKYMIVVDRGTVELLRNGVQWIPNPEAAKMLISIAYELACLRMVVKEAIKLVEYTNKGSSDLLPGFIGGLEDVIRRTEGYTDIRQNLDNSVDHL